MKTRSLHSQIQRIEHLFKQTSALPSADIQAHWAKYLCVLCAGYLENALREIANEFIKNKADPRVVNFAARSINKIQNPKIHKFVEVLNGFSQEWGRLFKDYADKQGRGEAIDSIMNNRHNIAHGKDSTITIARLRSWLDSSLELVEYLEQICQ